MSHKVSLSLALLASVCLPATALASFSDVSSSDPDFTAISILENKGIIQGITPGIFGPDLKISRAELLKVALEGNGVHLDPLPADLIAQNNPYGYLDVRTSHSLAQYINYASVHGYAHGYGDGYFRPNQPVSFAEASKILLKIAGYSDYVDAASPAATADAQFTSDRSLAVFYNRAVQQDLFFFNYAGYKARVNSYALRRDIARAMANVLRWQDSASSASATLFTCVQASTLTAEQLRTYFGPLIVPNSDAPGPKEVCISDELHYGFGTFESGFDNMATNLVTFNTGRPYTIRISREFAKNNRCVVGARHGADLTFQCNTVWVTVTGNQNYSTDFVYNFITGKLTSNPR